MVEEHLVPVNKYSKKIKELTFLHRITIDYPILCRESVAKKLAQVASKLPNEYFLQVDSGYRTKRTQDILYDNRKNIMPALVKNPRIGSSSHNTGGAVDVTLTDTQGREINLSEPFSKYYQEPQLISNQITEKAQNLRIMLNKLMLEAGFVPHRDEYWHFSYGDALWAEFTKNQILYEEVELNATFYYSPFTRFLFKILRKMYSFKNKILKIETNV